MANSSAVRVFATGGAASTPTSDTRAVQATGNELQTALHLFESESAAFAKSVVVDPAARNEYARHTKAAVSELVELVKQRKITPHEAARSANAMRNQLMVLARSRLSDFGLTVSRDMKANGRALAGLEEAYAKKRFGRAFASLTQAERDQVWMEIVHAAGRSNPKVNLSAKWFGIAGRTILVVSLACAVYHVATAEDHVREAAKEGTGIAAGAAGGAIGTATVLALASNPAGWAVGLALIVGAAIAAAGSNELFDYFWPER
jgi:hypothetical protein